MRRDAHHAARGDPCRIAATALAMEGEHKMGSDNEWEKWGRLEPYFGVITAEKYFRANLTDAMKNEFFESGRIHIEYILETCRRHLDRDFAPKRTLDFGCGVGRIVLPLAKMAEHVVGIDVAESMLDEARKNCTTQALRNVRLIKSDDALSLLDGSFDFIHSYIVFQHIPIARGRRIFAKLIDHLADGGIAAIHFTYSKSADQKTFGVKLPQAWRALGKHRKFSYRERSRDLRMQMNPYNLNELFFIMQSKNIRNFHVEFCDHDGQLGVFLYFQKHAHAASTGYRP